MEGVAFDPRLRQDDVIRDIRGLDNHRRGTAPRRKVARVWTEGDRLIPTPQQLGRGVMRESPAQECGRTRRAVVDVA